MTLPFRLPLVLLLLTVTGCGLDRPAARGILPETRWDHRPDASEWTRATLAALESEGAVLVNTVPGDVGAYCPGYAKAAAPERKAFWVGLLSVMAGHESGWNPAASGGGGAYRGLMQISDGTAAANGCATGKALYDATANLTCAVSIMSGHVARDGEIFGNADSGWLGVARDWVPFRKPEVRADLADWTSEQGFCR